MNFCSRGVSLHGCFRIIVHNTHLTPRRVACTGWRVRMHFSFSRLGQKFTARSGILELMDDLGRALTTQPEMRMLGGGNPAAIPEMQQIWRRQMDKLLATGDAFDRMVGNYDPPQGNPQFAVSLAAMLRRKFGWEIGPENIAITNGGQSAFFYLFNLLGGEYADGTFRKILLPLTPEYIGYADQGVPSDLFHACRPKITWPQGEFHGPFKYTIDFDVVEAALKSGSFAAMVASRPTNPTGNVLTDDEVQRLAELAKAHEIPLILDNAYGAPFPGAIFTDAKPFWSPETILTLSLSKLGLPGTRTAIVIAPPAIVQAVASMSAICGLSNGTIGQQIVKSMIEDDSILDVGPKIIRPFYEKRSLAAQERLRAAFAKNSVRGFIHASEGAFFHWLWLPDLKIPSKELYERLKARNVLVVPGEYFFFGLNEDWPHTKQCLRINYALDPTIVHPGLDIIAEEAARAS